MFCTCEELKRAVTYVGWVGHRNIGDEATHLINTKLFNQYRLIPTIKEKFSKVSLFGGGTLLPDYAVASYPNKYNYAIGIGVKNPNFWGPFDSYTKEMLKSYRFRFLGVRGNISRRILRDLDIEAQVVGDPVLLLEPKSYQKKNERLIALNVGVSSDRTWGDSECLLKEITAFGKHLKKAGYRIVLVPFWENDLPYINRLSQAVGVDIFDEWTDVQKVLNFIASCHVLIGQKLHSVVFSAATYTPFICIEYRPKCLDFTESVGFEKYTIRMDHVRAPKLTKLFCDLSDNWVDNRNLLMEKVVGYRRTLRQFAAQIIDDIESLPKDKWEIPGAIHTVGSRIFWGSDFFLYKNVDSFWNSWSASSLRKYVSYCRDLILFGRT